MLTTAERLIGAAASGVLVLGLVSSSYAGTPTATSRLLLTPHAAARAASPGARAKTGAHRSGRAAAATTPAPATDALPARAAAPAPPLTGCPPPPWHGGPGQPLAAPRVPDALLPAPLPVRTKATSLNALTGKGIWVTDWASGKVDVPGVVGRAKAAGLHSIWIRTGGSLQGYYGAQVLASLVPAAHRAGLRVVAWDFPSLSDPAGDAMRAKRALDAGIDGFAPDLETASEGTHTTTRRVTLYLSLVRTYAGPRPVAATVPRPTSTGLTTFPYAAFSPYAGAFVPMIYWSCNEPGLLVAQSLHRLQRWLPVAPVGQAYDMGSEGGRVGLPSRAETWRFLDAARRGGAVGASLWTIETIGAAQWSALSSYPWPGR